MKFHAIPKNFKRVMKFQHSKWHYKLYIDKNNSIWDIRECEVLNWKSVEKNGRKVNVPDQVIEKRDVELFNRVKGNPVKIAKSGVEYALQRNDGGDECANQSATEQSIDHATHS